MSQVPLFVFLSGTTARHTFTPRPDGAFFAARCVEEPHESFLITPGGIQTFPGMKGDHPLVVGHTGLPVPKNFQAHDSVFVKALGAPTLRALWMGFNTEQMQAMLETERMALSTQLSTQHGSGTFPDVFFRAGGVFQTGVMGLTRDAVVWLDPSPKDVGARVSAAKHKGPHVPVSIPSPLRLAMEQAMDLCEVALPQGVQLEDALDRVCVGRVHTPATAHGRLSVTRRLVDDTRLMPVLAFHLGDDPRPVVPVLL